MSDVFTEALVELREGKQRIANAIALLSEEARRMDERWQALAPLLRDHGSRSAPCSDIAPPYETTTHTCALLDDDGLHDDPPSRPIP